MKVYLFRNTFLEILGHKYIYFVQHIFHADKVNRIVTILNNIHNICYTSCESILMKKYILQ